MCSPYHETDAPLSKSILGLGTTNARHRPRTIIRSMSLSPSLRSFTPIIRFLFINSLLGPHKHAISQSNARVPTRRIHRTPYSTRSRPSRKPILETRHPSGLPQNTSLLATLHSRSTLLRECLCTTNCCRRDRSKSTS